MNDNQPRLFPWNKGRLIGPKPPLRPSQVWSIRTRLQLDGRARDLALFNLAIDSKLRGCDLVALRIVDVSACVSRGSPRLGSIGGRGRSRGSRG